MCRLWAECCLRATMKSRNVLASETNLMNAKMMQNMLKCTLYAGALSQSSKF